MKTTRSWLVLLLALLATVACLTEASSWIASSHSTDSPSWRINTSPDAWSERGDRCDYSADTLDGAETLKEDGFNRKPLCDKTVLVLSRQAESLSTLDPDFLASLPSLRSLIVPLHVNLLRVQNIISTVLERSSLEELEILHLEAGLDLDRQTSLKRLAIDASALDRLPLLRSVEEMVLMNPQGDIVSSLERICPHGLSLLTLVGAHDDLYAIDTSSLSVGTRVAFVVTSPPQNALGELDNGTIRRSSHASLSTITLILNDTWTNASLNNAVCVSDPSAVAYVALSCPVTATLWFRLPTCVSTFPALTQIYIDGCQMPVLNALPSSLTTLTVQVAYGSWTQQEAGVNPDSPTSQYFDWSWLSSVPNLSSLSFASQPINGTLPNEFSHSKMAYWDLFYTSSATTSNRLVGTISPNWFIQYPATARLSLFSNNLTGTIPYYGMEQLTELTLTNNKFTHWPPMIINATAGFGPPSKLTSVTLDYNNLVQIPSESDFQAMRLTSFGISYNPSLSAPFPNLFATTAQRTSSSLLNNINANGCQFYGALPEIPAYQWALYSSAPLSLAIFTQNAFTGTIPSSWSNVKFGFLAVDGNPLQGTMATIDSNGLVVSQPVLDASQVRIDSNTITGPMFNISAIPTLQNLFVNLPNVDFCASYRAGFSFASKTLTGCSLTGNATMCPEAYPPTCTTAPAPPTAPVAPYSPPIAPPVIPAPVVPAPVPYTHNARQMKGYFSSPLPGIVNFDTSQVEASGRCIYLGSAVGSAQTGGIYMRLAECNDTSLTALIADSCGSSVQTFLILNDSYVTGEEASGTMVKSFNGVTYTEYHLTCYDPTPSQVLPPTPIATSPPVPAPTPVPALGCSLPSPGVSFVCVGVQWVSDGSVDVGTLSIPRSSVTVIQGNLTTSSLVIASATSTINVTGCATTSEGDTPSITLTLTQEDLDEIIRRGGKLTTVLLQQSSECGAIGASVVNVDTRAIKSCKKIETNKISSSSSLSMAFRVSNSGCNTWWIILVSVVCGVIILAIGVVIVLAIVWRPFREKIRPFSRKRSSKGAIG